MGSSLSQRGKIKELGKILFGLGVSNAPSTCDIPLPQSWPPEHEKRIHEHGATGSYAGCWLLIPNTAEMVSGEP